MFSFELIPTAHAATVGTIVANINRLIINPMIILLFVLAGLMFVWGLVEFLMASQQGEVSETGKQHMIWGTIGIVIMVSVFGIMNLIIGTLGLTGPGGKSIEIPKQQK
jgi:uncharacterized membrane protein YidH (DUF202 family)